MANNVQKTPLARSLNVIAENKARQAINVLGQGLPCSVVAVLSATMTSIVTVKFELDTSKIPFTLPQVTIPMFGPEWIRYPVQVGDTGVVIPFDAKLGGITGLGSGLADLSTPANLGALVFMPIAKSTWSHPEDLNKIILYGPNGAVIRSKAGTANITVTTNSITLTAGSTSITINSNGVTINSNVRTIIKGTVNLPDIPLNTIGILGDLLHDSTNTVRWSPI